MRYLATLFLLLSSLAHGQDGWWYEPDTFDAENRGVVLNRLDDVVVFSLYTEWESCFASLTPPIVSPPPPPSQTECVPGDIPPTVSPPPPEPITLQCDCGMPFWVTAVSDTYDKATGLGSGSVYFSPNFIEGEAEAIRVGQFFYVEDPETETVTVQVAHVQNLYLNRCHGLYGEYVMDRLINTNLVTTDDSW